MRQNDQLNVYPGSGLRRSGSEQLIQRELRRLQIRRLRLSIREADRNRPIRLAIDYGEQGIALCRLADRNFDLI